MGKKMLLVEDNEGDQFFLKEALSEVDNTMEVVVVSSGEAAVTHVQEQQFDVALVDTILPGMDGFETCKHIKAVCGDTIKIIIMTGVVDAVNVLKAKEMGADDYCVKTSNLDAMMGIIRSFC